jgi:hypothetical protein
MRGRVCRLQLLLVLARTVIFGSESLGTRDHISLSKTRDFTSRLLIRLAGLRWRYSTSPPHRGGIYPRYISRYGPHRKRLFHYCFFARCRWNMSTELFVAKAVVLLSVYGAFTWQRAYVSQYNLWQGFPNFATPRSPKTVSSRNSPTLPLSDGKRGISAHFCRSL